MSESRAAAANRSPRLMVFIAGQVSSALGDAITLTIMPVLVLSLTGSGTTLGLLTAVKAAPSFVLALPAGALADRSDARRLMSRVDVGRALLMLAIPVALSIQIVPSVWALGVILPFIGAGEAIFMAAAPTALAGIVGRERFVVAFARMQTGLATATIVGPVLAPIVASSIGMRWALVGDAATFAISAVTLWWLRELATTPAAVDADSASHPALSEVRAALRFVAGHPALRPLLTFWTLLRFLDAPMVAAAAFIVEVDHRLPRAALGEIFSTYAAGAVLGAIIASRRQQRRLDRALCIGIVLMGTGGVALGLAKSEEAACAASLLAGVGRSLALTMFTALRVHMTPDTLMGRVSSISRLLMTGAAPLALVSAGPVLDLAGGATTLLITSVGVLGIGLALGSSHAIRCAANIPIGASTANASSYGGAPLP